MKNPNLAESEFTADLGLDPIDKSVGLIAALFHDAGKVMTMQMHHKTPLGHLVDHDSLTLSALHHALERLDCSWPDAAIALRHIWTCRSSKHWGFKAKMPVALAVQKADQISSAYSHEEQAFAPLPAWRNSATHAGTGERYWRLRPHDETDQQVISVGGWNG